MYPEGNNNVIFTTIQQWPEFYKILNENTGGLIKAKIGQKNK